MKIGIIADTHDHMDNTKKAVSAFAERGVKKVYHCGDIVAPFVVPVLKGGGFEECVAVFGNNDGEWLLLSRFFQQVGSISKPPLFTDAEGKRIALLHEPLPMDAMESLPVDIVAFGHTHEIVVKEGRPLVVNPGECCGYLTGRATVAVADLEEMKAEIIDLG